MPNSIEFLVSACLAGRPCAYDGRPRTCPAIASLVKEGRALPVCPECLGGLPVPRIPAEIAGGTGEDVFKGRARVINQEGQDVTGAFLRGAQKALKLARGKGISTAILKSRSPSCGYGSIYDGSFTGRLRPGHGVTAALLSRAGFKILTESEVR